MKRPESNLLNMILSLGGVTIVAAVLLAWVNGITEEPIKEAKIKTQTEAMNNVLPDHDNDPLADKATVTLDNGTVAIIYPAKKDGKLAGAAVETQADGFADKIAVIYGFEADGTVRNYSVLQHSETPGLGSKMESWFRDSSGKRNIIGHNPGKENMTVTKDGGSIDAITAATISSRAFLKTLNDAFAAYMKHNQQNGGGNE